MIWLAIHMWVLLLSAFAVGVAIGWWMRKGAGEKTSQALPAEAPLGTLDADAPGAAE